MSANCEAVLMLDELLPTLNELTRMHFGKIIRLKRKWQRKIKAELLLNHYYGREPLQKANLVITRHSKKCPDYDNMVGGAKHLIDIFTTPVLYKNGSVKNKYGLGVVVDDSPKYLTVKYDWQHEKYNSFTIIRVENILKD